MLKKRRGAIMKRDQRMVEFTEHINKFMQQTVHAFSLVDKQLSELNSVLFALLKDMGKLEDADCESCGKNITSPVINGLSKKKECPTCCESPSKYKQSAVEDWDRGSAKDHENVRRKTHNRDYI